MIMNMLKQCREVQIYEDIPIYKKGLDSIAEFPDVFSAQEYDQLPEHHHWDYAIKLEPEFELLQGKIYPLSSSKQQQLKEFINKNLTNRQICLSASKMASPFFFFIKKKDGTLQLVQDYKTLNKGTVKNKYLLPLIQEFLNRTNNVKYFTIYDGDTIISEFKKVMKRK